MRSQRDFKGKTRDNGEKQPNVSVSVTWSQLANRSEADAVESMLFVRYFSNLIQNSEP